MFHVFSPIIHPCFLPCLFPLIPEPSNGKSAHFPSESLSASTLVFVSFALLSYIYSKQFIFQTLSTLLIYGLLYSMGLFPFTVLVRFRKEKRLRHCFNSPCLTGTLTFIVLKSELCRTEDSIQVCCPHREKARSHPLIQMEFIFGCSLCFIPINLYLAAI